MKAVCKMCDTELGDFDPSEKDLEEAKKVFDKMKREDPSLKSKEFGQDGFTVLCVDCGEKIFQARPDLRLMMTPLRKTVREFS